MPSALSTTFTLHVTLGYGSDKSVQETLNKACKVPPPPAATTASLVSSYFSSSFFGSSSSSSSAAAAAAATAATTATARASLPPPTNGKFFVSSACQIDLTVDPTQQSTALLAVLIPPLVIDRYLETYTSTTNIQASGSCFWITDTNATELAQDLLPNIHPTLVHSTQILGIVRTSIATEENAPAEFLILQLVNRQTANATTTTAASATVVLPPMTISDILNSTNGQALAVDSAAILKVLPLSRVHFELSTTSAVAKAPDKNKNTTTSNVSTSSSSWIKSPSTTTLSKPSQQQQHSQQQQQPYSSSTLANMFGGKTSSLLSSPLPPPSIPTCPVCIHRIDPVRLGLPPPSNEHLCSKFCPPPNLIRWATAQDGCPKQRFLQPWSHGSRCKACRVIQQYWNPPTPSSTTTSSGSNDYYKHHKDSLATTTTTTTTTSNSPFHASHYTASISPSSHSSHNNHHNNHYSSNQLYCYECSMHKTLWVCLTCGHVGCGRYSNRHSVQHFQQTQHPYSLELATLRIWDYVREDRYAHRVDLLECPSCLPLAHPSSWWRTNYAHSTAAAGGMASAYASYMTDEDDTNEEMDYQSAAYHTLDDSTMATSISNYNYNSNRGGGGGGGGGMGPPFYNDELVKSPPKKATMIGEEYEALLQSALEDQAQHYEGEITRLRADLAASLVDQTTLSSQEQEEMDTLTKEISQLRLDIETTRRSLLDAQAQEAKQRAKSHRLLKEQQEAHEVIQKIESESKQEAYQGRMQMEELEQQVKDLTANLKMRQRFSKHEEWNQADIVFGADTNNNHNHNNNAGGRSGGKRGKKKSRNYRK